MKGNYQSISSEEEPLRQPSPPTPPHNRSISDMDVDLDRGTYRKYIQENRRTPVLVAFLITLCLTIVVMFTKKSNPISSVRFFREIETHVSLQSVPFSVSSSNQLESNAPTVQPTCMSMMQSHSTSMSMSSEKLLSWKESLSHDNTISSTSISLASYLHSFWIQTPISSKEMKSFYQSLRGPRMT